MGGLPIDRSAPSTKCMDIKRYNSQAWDHQVAIGNRWTLPVSKLEIADARKGEFSLVLTPNKPVPADWFPPLKGCRTLCLASGGGQQAPILAAAGAAVTVLDNSAKQLQQDELVAEREGLDIRTVLGDMRDLSALVDESFDFIFHPSSNTFVESIQPVWNEAFRVLSPGGVLVAGMCNPVLFIFDYGKYKAGELVVRHTIPYSDIEQLTQQELEELTSENEPLCFGHTMEDQIGGQLRAGFALTGFYEDYWGEREDTVSDSADNLLDKYLPAFFATRAVKPTSSN